MVAPIYELAVPSRLNDFHFKIREPAMPKHNFELRLELWIEAIMTQTFQYSRRPLSLAEVIWEDDDKVVFIRFRLRSDEAAGTVLSNIIRDLCEAIVDSKQNHHVKTLSHRGLLGISPIHRSAERPFRDAIARRTYQDGLEYLQKIDDESRNYLPPWQIAMHFACVAGINIFPLRYARLYSAKLANQQYLSWKARLQKLYGPAGVEIAASFLTKLLDGKELDPRVTEQHEKEYRQELKSLQGKIEAIIERMRAVRAVPEPTLAIVNDYNDKILDLCYEALGSFAECMISQKSLMIAYIETRKDTTKRMSREAGYSVAMLFNSFIMVNSTVPVPLAQMTAKQVAQTGLSWFGFSAAPTMAAFSPVTIGISVVMTAYGAYTLYTTAQEKKKLENKINRLKKAATLLSSAWTVTDETALFLKWVNCYGGEEYQLDKEFFEEAGAKGLVKCWNNLVKDAKRQEGGSRRASGGEGQNGTLIVTLRWISGQPRARNNDNGKNRRRVMIRCILGLMGLQAKELDSILRRSREVAEHN